MIHTPRAGIETDRCRQPRDWIDLACCDRQPSEREAVAVSATMTCHPPVRFRETYIPCLFSTVGSKQAHNITYLQMTRQSGSTLNIRLPASACRIFVHPLLVVHGYVLALLSLLPASSCTMWEVECGVRRPELDGTPAVVTLSAWKVSACMHSVLGADVPGNVLHGMTRFMLCSSPGGQSVPLRI